MNRYVRILRLCYSGLVRRTWPEGFCLGFLIRAGDKARKIARRKLTPDLGINFINRSKASSQLVVVLVGYKPELWPLTLERIARFVPRNADVCLATSGRRVAALDVIAQEQGWSYLSTSLNEVSTVQNLAIEKHPVAQYIFKLDEDIFVGKGYFEMMLQGHLTVKQAGLHKPGISAPLININGYSYIEFLKELGLSEEYKARFGELQQSADKIRAHYDGEAARWLWERSLPFDEIVQRFANSGFKYSTCPHRFSIGAILFERSLWTAMGGLAVNDYPGGLGYDEEHLCKYCLNSSEVIVVLHNVFAGHFGFGPQNQIMLKALNQLIPGLTIKPDINQAGQK